MQKNYPFFETTLSKPVNGIFQNKNAFGKNTFQRFFVLFFLILTNFGYSQLATESFESGIPATWAIGGTQGGTSTTFTNNWVHTPTGGYLASGGATVNPSTNNTVGTTAEYFMITPQFLTPTDGQIRFFTKQGSFTNRGTVYQLRISTANQPDLSSFNVTLQSWTESQLNVAATTWEEKIVNIPTIPAGIPVYLAFVAITNQTGTTATSGDSWFIDNARVISSCSPVTNPMIVPSETGAAISWTHPTATQFGIDVVPTGAGHSATGTPTGNSYNAEGLDPSTSYDVYIIANCDSSTNSTWAGPFPFSTTTVGLSCNTSINIPPDVTTTPFVLSDNLDQYYDNTTYVEMNSQDFGCQPIGQTGNQLLGNHVYLSYTPTTSGLINITQTANAVSGGGGNNCYNNLSSVFIFDGCAGVGTSAACIGAMVTTSNATTAQISNFYAVAGQNYVFVISSPFQRTNPGAGLCFTFTISGSTCPSPSQPSIAIDALQQNTATASWDNVQNLVSAWEYIALPATSPAPTAGQTGTIPTTTNVNNPLSGLTAGFAYNLYVRSVCNGTPGEWSAPRAFTTQCNTQPLPYYTGFTNASTANGNPEPCWAVLNLNNDAYAFNYGGDWQGEPVAKLSTGNAGNNTDDMLITPQFNFDGVTQKRLRFTYSVYGNWGLIVDNPTGGPGSFEILLSTGGVGEADFTTVLVPLTSYTTAYNRIEMIVPIPTNIVGNANIAWKLPSGALQTGIQFYIDDVYVEDMPACSEPSYPTITPGSITNTSLELSWTNGYNNTQWQIVAQPEGTGTPTTTGILVNTNPYTLTDLIPSTRYEIYVRAYCNETEQSIWAGPIFFHTLCDPQPTPYHESFDDSDPNTKKFCWSQRNIAGDNTEWRINENDATIQAAPSFFIPFGGFDDWLVSGPVNAVGLKRLRYNYRAVTGIFNPAPRGNFEVLLSTTPDFATYTTIIPSHDFTNTSYEERTALFTGTGVMYIAFRVPPTMTDFNNSGIMFINDVTIDDAPACPFPTDLTATNPTPNGITLGWTAGYNETAWEIAIQDPGEGIPTGNGVSVLTTPSTTQGGLQPNTAYEYYVRAVCSETEKSDWRGPISFRTDCVVYPSPFIETFEPASDTKSCWRVIDGNLNGDTWQLNTTVNPIFGEMMAGMFTGNNGNNDDWLISPTITVQPNQRLRFYYKTYSEYYEEDLKVKISLNGTDITQFNTIIYENNKVIPTDATGTIAGVNTITMTNTDGVRIGDRVDIPGWVIPYGSTVTAINGNVITISGNADVTAAGPLNVTFVHEIINNTVVREAVINLTGITAPTNINFGFYVPYFPPNPWNYRGQLLFIDNFIIEDVPACPTVSNVSVSNIIDTSASINWQPNGTETSWEISVQPFGTPAPTGDTLPEYLYTATAHPYVVTNLTPATKYEYYIRAVCTDGGSQWVGPFEFTTRCDFTNVCQYTITVTNGNTGTVTDNVSVMQNGVEVQAIEFPGFGQTSLDYTIFLCTGVEFNLYWNGFGSGVQYSEAQMVLKDEFNNVIWTSPPGLGTVNTNLYTGFASCGVITCPQPTNLAVNNQGVLSWTAGGSEEQWEVAIQPMENGTLPQSGTIVNSPNYTPTAADFADLTAGTYEFFVRAICGTNDNSYWSGPKVFIRNDEPTTALRLQTNVDEMCNASGTKASFIGATASTVPTTCEGVNGGDIWFDFVATSKVHYIEIKDLAPGSYYDSSFEGPWPKIITSLYEELTDGSLVEKGCSDNNSFTAIYSSELTVGTTYKIRLKLNDNIPNSKTFSICVTTPNDMCDINAFNYDFEKLAMQGVTGVSTIITHLVVPGWRTNTDWGTMFFSESINSIGSQSYSGGQHLQITADGEEEWDPTDPNIKGLYKDMDTSEATEVDYSFASGSRAGGSAIQLYAGPVSGPFELVIEDFTNEIQWKFISGTYNVPVGQTKTRFIFRPKENAIGHIIDAANFKIPTEISTEEGVTLDCTTTTTTLVARGIGQWIADENNPSAVVIASPNSGTTSVSGFNSPGNYVFHWKTRYCEQSITVEKQGTTDVPQVTSPVNYCLNDTATALTATVATGNTMIWYTQPTGGTGTTVAPTPSTATAGNSQMFYVAAVDANGCEGARVQIVVQVNDIPTATISGTTTICEGTTTVISFVGTPNAVVTYTINGGSNQTVTLDATGVGSVTTATLTANANYVLVSASITNGITCTQTLTGSALVTVEPLATVTISGTTAICDGSTATITFNGTANATVTYTINGGANQTIVLSAAGNASITTPALSTTATYALVSVAAPGSLACSQNQTGSAVITVNPIITPETDFDFDLTYCTGSENELPNYATGFTTGGLFSAPTGLSINTATGEINFGASTAGTYLIRYRIEPDTATCNVGGESTFEITVSESLVFTIDQECENSMLTLFVVNPTFDTNAATYTWTQNGSTVGTDETFNAEEYLAQNPSLNLPLTFQLAVGLNGCDSSASYTVDNNPCQIIPRGISPNNDELNDTFNLTGFGVRKITIFNRYGVEVFTFSGNYTNQWKGQTDGGKDLPDGTYFYSLETTNGTKTGWVYINREY
ncbi:MAG TPA: choice-of-anchor J domain-containing protein [Flavobacterium sp.]|nr:choice-of-anchor J domain-containing protein [Flavobacterium sp.]